jgi:hypothetical protein
MATRTPISNDRGPAIFDQGPFDPPTFRRVADGVVDEVGDQALEKRRVAADAERSGDLETEFLPFPAGRNVAAVADPSRDLVQGNLRIEILGGRGLDARQKQQVVDDHLHMPGFLERSPQRFPVFPARTLLAEDDLDLAPDSSLIT